MRLASPVVSSALQCGEEQCDTSSLNLTTPVRIQFRNTPEIQVHITLLFSSLAQGFIQDFKFGGGGGGGGGTKV